MNRRTLGTLLFFTAAALVLTYPLVMQLGDHVPGTATWSLDEYGYVWNNWWFKYALFDHGLNPLQTNYLFYPLGTSLVLYEYTLLHVLLAVPLQFAFGLIPAVNLLVLFSFVTAAFGMYLFAFYLLRLSLRLWSEKYGERLLPVASNENWLGLPAVVAGIVYAFTSNRYVYLSLGHYNIVASEWLPFYLLFLFKTLLEPGWKNALLAGLFAAFALYTETTDGVLLALLTAVIMVFEWRLINRTLVQRILLLAATAALLFSPLLVPTLTEIFAGSSTLTGWGHSEKLLVDLNGFFTPTSLNPLTRNWEGELDQVRQGISRFSDVNTFFVGYVTALIALLGFIRFARRTRMWLAIALIFSVLSLGPLLHVNGQSEFDLDGLTTSVPLPFLILHYIPLIRENRVPNRYSILVTIALAILVAYGLVWLLNLVSNRLRLPGWALTALTGLVASLLLFEHLATPIPLTDAHIPEIYGRIAREPGEFTVLSLPLGWRNSFGQTGAEDTRTQYYQSAGNKFLLSGQIQRNPPILFEYFQRAPIMRSIISLETYNDVDQNERKADKAKASEFVYFFDIRFVVVNAPIQNRPPFSDTHDRVLDYVKQVLPLGQKVFDQDGTVAYQVNQPAAQLPIRIEFGGDLAGFYLGEGWTGAQSIGGSSGSWSTRQGARVFFPVRGACDCAVTVRAIPFEYAGHTQTLTISMNGHRGDTVLLKPGWNEYQFRLERNDLHSGLNELRWDFGYLVRPSEAVPPNFQIGRTGINSPVDIAVQSSKEFASIKVSGREYSPLKRGYNLVAIHPTSGSVIAARNFDTGGESPLESRALSDFLSKQADGTIIAGSIQEDAAAVLDATAAKALQSIGLTTDVRGKPGFMHAFIAVKGQNGASEASGEGPSAVSVGHSTDDRLLGVGLDWIVVQPATSAVNQ